MTFVTLDLVEIRDDLGRHYRASDKDAYRGTCSFCGEAVSQQEDCCPVCGVPVVWLHSPAWRRLFGSPTAAIQRLSTVPPEDSAGTELCKLAGVTGFANQSEAKRWKKACRKLNQERMAGIVQWAAGKGRGRAIIARALNLADKIVREESATEGAPKIIRIPKGYF